MNDDASTDSGAATPPPKPAEKTPQGLDAFFAWCDKWHAQLVSVGALFAAAANVKLFVEAQWVFAATMLLLCAIGGSLYIVSHTTWLKDEQKVEIPQARLFRRAAFAILASVPLATLSVFFFLAFWPRITEHGPIIAIARFDGPKLPSPYEDCRPSDMLADTLTDITHHYNRLILLC